VQDGGDEGYSYSWDDPTSPAAVLGSYTALPAEFEVHQNQLYHRELAAVGFGLWLENALSDGSVTVTAEVSVPGKSSETPTEPQGKLEGPFVLDDFHAWVGMPRFGTGNCVLLLERTMPELAPTRAWREGDTVLGNDKIKPGTAIATFVDGRYPNRSSGNHAAYYAGQGVSNGTRWISVVEQWPRGSVPSSRDPIIHQRYIYEKQGSITNRSNDARAFSVILRVR
jgi:hypothetical protein